MAKLINFFSKKTLFNVTIWFKDGSSRSFQYKAVSKQYAIVSITSVNRYANIQNLTVDVA